MECAIGASCIVYRRYVERTSLKRVICTLQKVRAPSRDNVYAANYNDVSVLKAFADANELAVLVVHHARKMGDADVFNIVSGTTGITGSADSTFVLAQQSRCSENATLSVTGRDIEFQELKLRLNDCKWELIEKTSLKELEEREVPDCVLNFMGTRQETWEGTALWLMEDAGIENFKTNAFGKHLAQQAGFLRSRGIEYSRKHSNQGTILGLAVIE